MCIRTTSENNTVFSGIFAVKSNLFWVLLGYPDWANKKVAELASEQEEIKMEDLK